MPVMLQVRNVPDEIHRQLKARAALKGMTLSDFALAELRRSLERPAREDLLARIRARPRVVLPESAATAIRHERDAR